MIRGGRALGAAAVVLAAVVSGCSSGQRGEPRAAAPPVTSTSATPAPATVPSPQPDPTSATPEQARTIRTPCTSNQRPKWVFVSLRKQHMWMCHRGKVAFDTAITSGMTGPYTHTPTGSYRIQGLNRNSTLTLNTGATYQVKFWIPFDAPLFGFHDSSWQHFAYGSPRYRTNGSHGCIHMPLGAIRFFYHWADIGTPLRIRG
jgi:lipoprotein-anchoring transpeptidase ErfK/SrfK